MLGPTHRAFGVAAVTGVYAVTKPWLPPDTFPIIGLQLGLLQGGTHWQYLTRYRPEIGGNTSRNYPYHLDCRTS